MEEDNLFGEIDDFLNTTTNAFDTSSNGAGPPIAQVRNKLSLQGYLFLII